MATRQSHEIIPSGKYKGWSLGQVPSDYISWLTHYGKGSYLHNWYNNTKQVTKKAKTRHKQVGGNQPAQGVKTGPVHSGRVFRVRTNADGTTTRIEVPR
jgi:hypothetical protein